MHLRYRQTCRTCGSAALTKVIDLGEQFIQGSFVKEGYESPPMRKIPLQLVRCDPTRDQSACGLLQTSVTVPPEILYSTYWYRSGTNRTMREHLKAIAEKAVALVGPTPAIALDVGCNDGTLLACYPDSVEKYGVDPSNAIESIGKDVVVIQDRFPSSELTNKIGDRRFDIITSIAMFYDLEDPIGFVRAVADVLSPEGVWIFEMSYMPSMLRTNSYDTICHEHIEYYSLAAIEFVLSKAGMKLFGAELNDINGGSIRCYASHDTNFRFREPELAESLTRLRRLEFDLALDTDKPYRDFQDQVDAHKNELTRLIKDLKRAGKRVHVYGASTKGNVILQFCGIDNSLIDFAADRNPDKWGARTIGTDIPIISEDDSREMHPDYYLVLPWHFRSEFVERERETLRRGTKFIFPLPAIEIVEA
ncbi:MAG TPA: class I SAM-dependent methyltransferase [Thermomicrobiales bacterium]|nr:class I SAM-dependent methyltransferase [Thermomicrobiales bacterium]